MSRAYSSKISRVSRRCGWGRPDAAYQTLVAAATSPATRCPLSSYSRHTMPTTNASMIAYSPPSTPRMTPPTLLFELNAKPRNRRLTMRWAPTAMPAAPAMLAKSSKNAGTW